LKDRCFSGQILIECKVLVFPSGNFAVWVGCLPFMADWNAGMRPGFFADKDPMNTFLKVSCHKALELQQVITLAI
jgi:hypothetical protein